ncbi:MAG: hypothetical protein GY803_07905 [Chloroflexi bacterium]|nr:hypothetical protein [Chloroflexota bacterium]
MDGLEADLGEQVQVARINIHDEAAQSLLTRLDFEFSPTFILFDGVGNEVWREKGVLDPEIVKQKVAALQ